MGYIVLLVLVTSLGLGMGMSMRVFKLASQWLDKASQGEIEVVDKGVSVEAKELYVSSDKEVTYELIEGWNFIALPLLPTNFDNAAGLIREVVRQGGQVTTVSSWDGDRWQEFSQRGREQYGNNFKLEPGKAYFVRSHKQFSWQVRGDPVKVSEFVGYQLQPGWNSLGLFDETKTARQIIDGINIEDGQMRERATVIDWWTTASNWELFIKRIYSAEDIEEYGENFAIKKDRGYMIFVNQAINWRLTK